MAETEIKNISGEDRTVPALGGRLVLAGAVVSVPSEDVKSYTCQDEVWAALVEKKHTTTKKNEG